MDKKVLIKIIVMVALIILTIVFSFLSNKPLKEKIIDYISKVGFKEDVSDSFYYRQVSDKSLEDYNKTVSKNKDVTYEGWYFDLDNYQLTSNEMSHYNDATSVFNPKYDYINKTLTYTYRLTYNNSVFMAEGKLNYSTDKVTCKVTYSYGILKDEKEDTICDGIEKEVRQFDKDAKNLIINEKLLKEIEKVVVE